LDGVQVLDTLADAVSQAGRGISVQDSTLEATDCLVQGNRGHGLFVDGSNTTLQGVQVLDTRRDTVSTAALGIGAQSESTVVATDLYVQNTDGPALYVVTETLLRCTGCTLIDNAFAGAVVQGGGELVLEDSLIEGTMPGSSAGAGLGVYISDFGLEYGYDAPSLILLDSTIRDNEMGAVYIKGSGTYQVTGNELSGGPGLDVAPGMWVHGDAVFVTAGDEASKAWDEEEQVGLLLQDNTFSNSTGAGVFLDGASATLSGNTYEDNSTDLFRQACGEADAPEGLDDEPLDTTSLCPDHDYLTQELRLTTDLFESEAEL
ncbi:MAG: right-handed parallel beta-helix repeat-containing protein, partial [Myxococcota bacterium]|nr:right-handed parallel beta-helix repeat-containing protein [Myxococcota bacterium]